MKVVRKQKLIEFRRESNVAKKRKKTNESVYIDFEVGLISFPL